MKKISLTIAIILFISISSLILMLTTTGVQTNKFNNLISDKASRTKNISLDLDTIKFKIDIKDFSLFLETQRPIIKYNEIFIPIKNIKAYVDFLSLLKSETKIKKTSIALEELDISQLKKLSVFIKPSNFKNFFEKIKNGKLISEIDIFSNDQGTLDNFIAKGSIEDLNVELYDNIIFSNSNLNFFADKNDILIKNIFGNLSGINISDGDIKLSLDNGLKIKSNFKSFIDLSDKQFKKYSQILDKFNLKDNLKSLKANTNNTFIIDLDNTYKVKNYNYDISGNIKSLGFKFSDSIKSNFLQKEIRELYFSDLNIITNFKPNTNTFIGEGKYTLNESRKSKINFKSTLKDKKFDLKLNLDYLDSIELSLINYVKPKNSNANLNINLEIKDKNLNINQLNFKDKENSIKIKKLVLKNNTLTSFKKIEVKTDNNDFFIQKDNKILIKGNKFDATNLGKFLNKQSGPNKLDKISDKIEIDFNTVNVPMAEELQNFKLLGEIKKGQFIKISSKGDFGGNNFLDITMKKDKNSDKKFLEIYSDLSRPLLAEYSFFKGLSGGNLLFTSIIDGASSRSKLKVENFKVVNAPGVIKLLSLADLGGLADLAEGEGLSFDVLEIDMEKNENNLKLNEILALGPSMSVLMEGYRDKEGLTSLRGTLVPAKTLNKMISKIPVIGNIVIPKEAGEGLFGISFKMKGPKGEIKTTINPIRTLTPRFIQKIIDKSKN